VLASIRKQLRLNAALVQIPIGLESELEGVIDIIREKAIYFDGKDGAELRVDDIPEEFSEIVREKRAELIETVAEVILIFIDADMALTTSSRMR